MRFNFTNKTAKQRHNLRMALVVVSALLVTVCSVGEMYLLFKVVFS